MELLELKCKNCGGQLAAGDISQELQVVRCHHCQAVYALQIDRPEREREPFLDKPRVPMPAAFSIIRGSDQLVIKRRWFHPMYLFLLFFAIIWNTFLLFFDGAAIGTGAWFLSLFGMIHTGVGLFLIYWVVAGFVNHTEIRVKRGQIRITHGPLPWPGNLMLSPRGLKQLFAKEHVRHGKNGPRRTYEVHAITASGHHRKLLKSLPNLSHAVFLEQQIEKFLEIDDRPVRGEAN